MSRVWAGYIRVSHVGGRAGDKFHSPQEQEDAIKAWASARGDTVDVFPPELDESGGRLDRPVLTEAIEAIEAGSYDGLLVAYLSRASRNVRHLLEIWDRIETAGGEVVSIAENIDTTTPAGRLTRTMLAAIAEHELDMHRERFATLRQTATARGVWQRRQTPKGYSLNPLTRHLVPDEDADKVRAAFTARVDGVPVVDIAASLGMTPGGARQLLRNRVYLGELRVGVNINTDAHEPIIDAELFDAAQTDIPRPSRGGDRAPALLASLVRCESCGHRMSRAQTKRLVYACNGRSSAGKCPRPAAITAALVDEYVERIAVQELARLSVTSNPRTSHVEAARSEVVEAEEELAGYLAAVSVRDVGAEAFAEGARGRRERLDAARAEHRRVLTTHAATPPAFSTGADAWEALSAHDRNTLLRSLLDVVIVRPAGRGKRMAVEDRVRVLAHGSDFLAPARGNPEDAMGIAKLPFPDIDDESVLTPASS